MSYLKMISEMKKSEVISAYSRHEGLLARLGKNYRVRMGFGLHMGWAIEGAIGSMYKIDASYLSPNVNISSRLEAATKQFGVPILVSGEIVDTMTPTFREECRHIDCVTVKGSKRPMHLWTVDLNADALRSSTGKVKADTKEKQLAASDPDHYKAYMAHKKLKESKRKAMRKRGFWNPDNDIAGMFQTDVDLRSMRAYIPKGFVGRFNEAFSCYEKGSWIEARDMLDKLKDELPGPAEDGPSLVLLNHMRDFNYQAPPDWEGYRILTDK